MRAVSGALLTVSLYTQYRYIPDTIFIDRFREGML